MTVVNINDIFIDETFLDAWTASVDHYINELKEKNPKLEINIPNEEGFRYASNRQGELYMLVNNKELKLRIPNDSWKFSSEL